MRHIHVISTYKGSLGEITADLIENLKEDFSITRETEEFDTEKDILLCHFLAPGIVNSLEFFTYKYKVLILPIDGTSIKKEFIHLINKFDLIITPGTAGKRIMEENGVAKPIVVIPNYYKNDLLRIPRDLEISQIKKLIKNKFVFYHESTGHPRKGVRDMLLSYVKAFSSNSKKPQEIFIYKGPSFSYDNFEREEGVKEEIIEEQAKYKYPAQIIKISQFLDEETLKKLWYITDCYVHIAGIEGFGIPLLRMCVLHKPVITLKSDISGYMDFIKQNCNAFLIPSKKIYASKELVPIYNNTTEWCAPIEGEMERIYKRARTFEPYSFPPQGLSRFTLEKVMQQYKDVLNNLNGSSKNRFVEGEIILEK